MSTVTDRRCGTCRHWSPLTGNPSVGDCGVRVDKDALPDSINYEICDMMEMQGAECPLWEAVPE